MKVMFAFEFLWKWQKIGGLSNNPSLREQMLCVVCQLLDFVDSLCNVFSSDKDLFLLTECGPAVWYMVNVCCLFDLFTPFLFWIFITLCVCVFRRRRQCHWAPTHKLSALDTQRRMLSQICPTLRTTVRPPPPSLFHSLCGSSFCFTFFPPQLSASRTTVCIYNLTKEWVISWLTWYVCLFRGEKTLLNLARWRSNSTKYHSMNIFLIV